LRKPRLGISFRENLRKFHNTAAENIGGWWEFPATRTHGAETAVLRKMTSPSLGRENNEYDKKKEREVFYGRGKTEKTVR